MIEIISDFINSKNLDLYIGKFNNSPLKQILCVSKYADVLQEVNKNLNPESMIFDSSTLFT